VKRVVVTGIGIISPLGNDIASVEAGLRSGRSGIVSMKEWASVAGLRSLVAGVAAPFDEKRIPRRSRRTMGRVAIMAALAAEDAAADAGFNAEFLESGDVGLAISSTTGSPQQMEEFYTEFAVKGIEEQKGTTFMKVMGHTAAANAALHLKVAGRLISPTGACSSSTQSIGLGYEAIKFGLQSAMICGGAEELHPTTAGTFDIVHAASTTFNDSPTQTPRPFDADRDGLVVGEGAAIVVLEERGRALARGATVYGEILSFATCGSGFHISAPSSEDMLRCMRGALTGAGLQAEDIDYINAHASGTELGDSVEAAGTRELFAATVPVSGTKGYTGHTLGACGAMETIFCLLMMGSGFIAPTLNLENISEDCQGLLHVQAEIKTPLHRVLNNSFAFGGINASLVLGAVE